MPLWVRIALGALAVLIICEEVRIYKVGREYHKRDEIFQAVTENAADMIALVDVQRTTAVQQPFLQARPGLHSGGIE